MAFVLLLIPVKAFVCSRTCLNSCLEKPTTACIKDCCPLYSVSFGHACELHCDEKNGNYSCSDKCFQEQPSCHQNCLSFCDHRSDQCVQACLNEFCGPKSSQTNWVFVIGLIILVCGFVVVLYQHLDNIMTKTSERELLYT
jgi:hypothetical protein